MKKHLAFFFAHATALCCLLLPVVAVGAASSDLDSKPKTEKSVQINFPDVDIGDFIRYVSDMTGKNFIVDPAVKGKITVISPKSISLEDAYRVFESVLEVHGYTTVPSGAVTKIVPSVQARSKSIPTIKSDDLSKTDDKVATRIIPLAHSTPEEVKKIISPLVSKTSVVISHDQSGLLILTDALSNINRLLEIIKAVDVPSVGEELAIIPLKHASVESINKSLGQLFVQSAAKGGRPATSVKIIPYERTNSLIVFAPKPQIDKIKSLLEQLDTEVAVDGGNVHVYYLQHANAEELVKVLTSLPTAKSSKETAENGRIVQPKTEEPKTEELPPAKSSPSAAVHSAQLTEDVKITADPETNALIVTASQEEYMALQDVIRQLDIPRRMVYLEALIMEVSVEKQFEIGAEWGGLGSMQDETGTLGLGFTNNKSKFSMVKGIAKGVEGMPVGATLGVLKKGVQIGDAYFPNLGSVLNAFQKDSDINIIATPQILTTDNKEASITVGENVPYITSKNSSTNGSEQDYTNYEYKDVGTTLKITPQINQAKLLRLDIGVEVTRLKSEAGVTTPTTYKRTATTTVVVHNQEIVVIGGMIGQDATSGDYKVPLLGDIPILGWLFKTHEDSQKKTNMFIFISPRIVESSPELASMYYRKRDVMEEVKKGAGAVPDQLLMAQPKLEHALAFVDKGFVKLQNKEYEEAEGYFLQALENAPENPHALINLGVVYEQQGRAAEAAEAYRHILALAGREQEEMDEVLLDAAREHLKHVVEKKEDAAQTLEPELLKEQTGLADKEHEMDEVLLDGDRERLKHVVEKKEDAAQTLKSELQKEQTGPEQEKQQDKGL